MSQLTFPLQDVVSGSGRERPANASPSHWENKARMHKEVAGDDHSYLRSLTPPERSESIGELRTVDLFSGCGGMSLGAMEAGEAMGLTFRSLLAVDLNLEALATYDRNFRPDRIYSEPIETLFSSDLRATPTAVERKLVSSLGRVDLLLGGPPCQGHSDLNNFARRSDAKNGLYMYMARAADILRPRYVVIENVVGAAHDKSRVVQRAQDHLESIGYSTSLGIVDAVRIGVPQRRRRLLLIASRDHVVPEVEALHEPMHSEQRDVRWAIGDLTDSAHDTLIDEVARPTPVTRKRIDYLFDNELYELPNEQRPACHRDKAHSYTSIYGRLRWNQVAQTVTRGFYCMCMGRYVHPDQRRTLTAHEAARIQFFPDFFDFSPVRTRSALAEIIGNAVPMKLSYAACLTLLASCAETHTPMEAVG